MSFIFSKATDAHINKLNRVIRVATHLRDKLSQLINELPPCRTRVELIEARQVIDNLLTNELHPTLNTLSNIGYIKSVHHVLKTVEKHLPDETEHKPGQIVIGIIFMSFVLFTMTGCVTTQKSANEQARDAYWLGQSDATKQLYFAKESTQQPPKEPQRNVQYYAIPVEPVPGVKEVPHNVVIPVEK